MYLTSTLQTMQFSIIKKYLFVFILLSTLTSCIKRLELDASKEIKDLKIKTINAIDIPPEIAIGYDSSVQRSIKKYNQTGSTIHFSLLQDTTEMPNLEFRFNKMRYASGTRRFTNLFFFVGTSAIILGTGIINYFPLPMSFISNSKLEYKAKGDASHFKTGEIRQKSMLLVPHGFCAGNAEQKIKHLKWHEKHFFHQLENLEYSYLINSKKSTRNEIVDRFLVGKNYLYFTIGILVSNATGTLKSKNAEFQRSISTNWGVGYLKQFSRNLAWQIEGNIHSGVDLNIKTELNDTLGKKYTNYQSYETVSLSALAGGIFSPHGIKMRPYVEAAINPIVPIFNTIFYTIQLNDTKNGVSSNVSPILLNLVGGAGFVFSPTVNMRSSIGFRYNKGLISYLENSDIFVNSMQYFGSFTFYFGGNK